MTPALPVAIPAFPRGHPYASTGMSLRDYFAGQALAAMDLVHDYSKGQCDAALSERAYRIADAMLEVRNK